MNIINKILCYCCSKTEQNLLTHLNDKMYLKMIYRIRMGIKLNLKKPITFNEKLQWLKIHDRKSAYTTMVDKYQVKKFISKKIGKEYVIPTLGIWNKFEEIDFSSLPEQFVLKCTHCGGVYICKDKSSLNINDIKKKINSTLKKNYFWHLREWPYKNVPPKIIAEEYIKNDDAEQIDNSLIVYKVFCFDGKPYILQVIQNDKRPNETIDYFDTEWNLLKLKQNFPNSKTHLKKPQKLDEMLNLSHKLSKGIPFLRVDWYISNNELLFSEFTFYSDAGMAEFEPKEWDYKLGEMIKLKRVKK